jgi:hypothetical protein
MDCSGLEEGVNSLGSDRLTKEQYDRVMAVYDTNQDHKISLKEAQMLMEVLPKYGAAAKAYLPTLKERNPTGSLAKPWAAMIQSIESAIGDGNLTPIEDLEPGP